MAPADLKTAADPNAAAADPAIQPAARPADPAIQPAARPADPAIQPAAAPAVSDAGDSDSDSDSDSVTRLLADWRLTQPRLDTSATGIVVRLGRIRTHIDAALADVYAANGISAADFAALSILRRNSEVPMSALADGLYLTAGTVTPRARRLADAGLVTSRPDPSDARVRLLRLTERGRRVFDAVAPAHLAVQRDALRALSPDQTAHLEALLAAVLGDLEGR